MAKSKQPSIVSKLGARPDTIDFRDLMYVPTLTEVPPEKSLEEYQVYGVPVLDQGLEGACTGFGLATVANYLLSTRKVLPDKAQVSPRMFYEMAKKYDEWDGEEYEGSSARGAMKGWHKHGVCSEQNWVYKASDRNGTLNNERIKDAIERPLGAYFRVNHKDLVALHCAIAEVGVLFVTSKVHEGWNDVSSDGVINFSRETSTIIGGHAFAIVGYNRNGFWFQNSWGTDWGKGGFGFITYDDWLCNGTDVWVGRLGAASVINSSSAESSAFSFSITGKSSQIYNELRPHIVSIGNDGKLSNTGPFGNTKQDLENIFSLSIPEKTKGWNTKRILFYAHGGLTEEDRIIQKISAYKDYLMQKNIYPVVFIWHTGFFDTLKNILEDAFGKIRSESLFGNVKDFMLDRLDNTLEILLRPAGKAFWDEMKENAEFASSKSDGGGSLAIQYLSALLKSDPTYQISTIGHSAGSIFLGYFLEQYFKKTNSAIDNSIFWAPACTIDLFKEKYLKPLQSGKFNNFSIFNLTDKVENDDNCAGIYHKSLLYLVSNSFEETPNSFFSSGTPILGMDKFIQKNDTIAGLIKSKKINYTLSPLTGVCEAQHHGDFDDDLACLKTSIGLILNSKAKASSLQISPIPSRFAVNQTKENINRLMNLKIVG